MTIQINDQILELETAPNVQTIVDRYVPSSRHLIVEVNGAIIRRENWPQWVLRERDRVELIQLVGGG